MRTWEQRAKVNHANPVAVVIPPAVAETGLECMACAGKAVVMFEGTSYCRPCLKEKFRMGT